ncbi:hypothetical protein QCE73_00055 [Caballeronia sp. LZ029]|uniref:hypothetical protein n=1 Tax=Caballeronia sp. LZ029 TaxID=3038564 RepID=UPI002863CEC6|nr:hypothetical protein [Caballeronia sp. LZ029]MDR5741540.1 hypothetical protein [Caballeronia sp. LZ029]
MSVDWLSFRVRLAETTQAAAFKQRFEARGVSWVQAHNAGPGNAATNFSVRVQDLEAFSTVKQLLGEINVWKGVLAPARIDGIEISFDATPCEPDPEALEMMTFRLMRQTLPPMIYSNARIVGADRRERPLLSAQRCALSSNTTLYIGDWGRTNSLPAEGLGIRAYKKTTDNNRSLPEAQHRARIEAVISGSDLDHYGLSDLDSLGGFRFERLAGLFRFATPIPGRLAELYVKRDHPGHLYYRQRGVDETAPACIINHLGRRDSRGRWRSKSSVLGIEPEMTEIARDQLRKLTRRFNDRCLASMRSNTNSRR